MNEAPLPPQSPDSAALKPVTVEVVQRDFSNVGEQNVH